MSAARRPGRTPSFEYLALLLAADLLFVVLHLFHHYSPYFSDLGFSLVRERSFSEVFQYVKEYWIALMFLWIGRLMSWTYWAWAVLFGYLLVDDSFSIHERIGVWLAERLDLGSYAMLRPRDLGELAASALVGIVLLSLAIAAYRLGDERFRRTSRRILLLLLLLAFFGVIVDMLHIMANDIPQLSTLLGALEDGGEMAVMSLISWYVLVRLQEVRAPTRKPDSLVAP